jgi:copper chaperone
MAEISLKIDGMSCQHCVASVKKAVDGVEGVSSSDITVGAATVVYDEVKTSKDSIVKVVQNAGYSVMN